MLGKEASIHLLISIIFNQSCKSKVAFQAPRKLLERMNMDTFDLYKIQAKGYNALFNAVALKPCLHRFPSNMARYTYLTICALNETYDADPRNIWMNKNGPEILKALESLNGIGKHKAIQCLIYLKYLGEINQVDDSYINYMAMNCQGFFENIDNDLCYIKLL